MALFTSSAAAIAAGCYIQTTNSYDGETRQNAADPDDTDARIVQETVWEISGMTQAAADADAAAWYSTTTSVFKTAESVRTSPNGMYSSIRRQIWYDPWVTL